MPQMRTNQLTLFPFDEKIRELSLPHDSFQSNGERSIEESDFPFEHLSDIAEAESWRKEINRPPYHIHKWWAQRLGSVFRAIVLAAFAPKGSNLLDLFYSPVRLPQPIIFDPFMGSGATIGEALKLGARAIGRDINPVAYFLVQNALSMPDRKEVLATFRAIERDVAPEIHRFYQAQLPNGDRALVLYYFWVRYIPCPRCKHKVDLFSSYIFTRHAYPRRHPEARALCPACGVVNLVRYDALRVRCASCRGRYETASGPVHGQNATCPKCQHSFPIAKTALQNGHPPVYRLYAKLVLTPQGQKEYFPADEFDRRIYQKAARTLRKRTGAYPLVQIQPGYNTDQVLNHSYKYWHEMFNARQLLCLSTLADRIREITDERQRALFTCLFSGALEFNNMFTSFKGEGTGAVRHMFYHHILKPERTPLEANVWGTPKSSGSFSTLFKTRILRALDYCENPFELRLHHSKGGLPESKKIFNLSVPLFHDVADTFDDFRSGKSVYLSCGDSGSTDLPPDSVDAVITDPPFFDNVHYSQLADFFFVWQRHILGQRWPYTAETTRSSLEVQQGDSDLFTERLAGVWRECYRAMKRNGILVFTYHHSRSEGWRCVLASVRRAGFMVVRAHPIKAEMSVAIPKHLAREPIDLDMILVCRKWYELPNRHGLETSDITGQAAQEAGLQIRRLQNRGRPVSRGDIRVILMAQIITRLSQLSATTDALIRFQQIETSIESTVDLLHRQMEDSLPTKRQCPR